MKRRLLNFLFSLFVLAAALCVPQSAWADDLIVNDGTSTNSYVPVYGTWADAYTRTQFIVPAADLDEMVGGTISSMRFYSSKESVSWGDATFQVRVLEVSSSAVGSAYTDVSAATLVYSGALSVSSNVMDIAFSSPYSYGGDNLLIDVQQDTKGTWSSATWNGASGSALYGYSSSSLAAVTCTAASFAPKMAFSYTPGAPATCVKPASLDTANVTSTTADLVWTAGGTETAYQLIVTPKNGEPVVSEETGLTKSLTGLQPNTDYTVGVRAICGEGDTSRVTYASFRTACGTLSAFPWKENFNEWNTGNINESCWLNEHLDGSSTSLFQVSSTSQGGNSTKKLYLPYMATGNITKLTLPEMNIPAANDYEFIIEMYRASSTVNTYYEEGLFVLAGNDTLGFISRIAESDKGLNVATTSTDVPAENASGWYKYKFTIPNAGVQNIALVGRSKSGSATYADNLCVRKIPACKQVTNIQMTEVTKTSAKFAWTPNSGETSWNVEYIITDWEDYDTIATVVSGTPELELTGLTKATSYGFAIAVQADCGAEQAEDIATAEFYFNTDCDIITVENEGDTIHFGFEDFESGVVDRPCYYNDGNASYWGRTSTPNSGSYALYAYGKSKHFVLGIPQVEIPENYELQFFVRNSSTYADTLEVYYNTVQSLEGATHLFSTGALSSTYTNYRVDAPRGEYYILFETHAGSTSSYFYIDDISFTPKPLCAAIKDITLGEVTATTATFSWTPGGEESLWNVNYNDGADMSGTEEWDETSFTFEDLEPATAYSITVSVQAICDGNVAAAEVPSMVLNFSTKDIPAELPYSNGFGDENENKNWVMVSPATGNKWVVGGATNSGNDGTMALYVGTAEDNTYVMNSTTFAWAYRTFNFAEAGTYNLSFDWKGVGEGTSTIWDGMMVILVPDSVTPNAASSTTTSVGELSSFSKSTTIAQAAAKGYILLENDLTGKPTFNQSESWNTGKQFVLSVAKAGKYKLCFGWFNDSGSGSNPPAAIDNISIVKKACENISGLKAESTTTSATLSWNNSHDTYSVKIMHGDSVLLENAAYTDTAFVVSGLKSAKSYEFNVMIVGICNADTHGDTLRSAISVATECDIISTLPWKESFDSLATGSSSASAPLCWELINANSGAAPYIYVNTNSSYVRTGSKSLFFSNNNVKYGYAVMPEFADLSNAMMTFSYKDENVTYSGSLDVGYLTDVANEATFVSLVSFPKSTSWVDEATVYFDTVPAGARIAFRYGPSSSSTVYYLGIDDIVVREIPSCIGATDLAVVDSVATTSSVTFSWKSDAPNFKVHYVSSDSTINQWVNTSLASLAISGLEPGKNYTFHLDVVAACSETDFAVDTLSGTLTAATKCVAVSELPFREYFEDSKTGSGNLPPCWEYTSATATNPYVYKTSSSYAGNNSLYFYGGSPSTVREVVLPEITADLSNARIRFYYKSSVNSSYTYGKLMLGAMTDPADASTFVGLDTLDQKSAYTLYEKNLNVGEAKYLVLRYAGGTSSSGSAYVDNLIIDEIPTCFPASNLHGIDSLATASSVSFGWTPNADETSWQVIVKQGNTVLADSVVADTVFTLGGLNHSSIYSFAVEVYVICGDVKAEALEGNLSLKTMCNPEPIAQFPWTESFENMPAGEIDMPCWENEHKTGTGTKLFTVATSAIGGNSTNKLQLPDMSDGTVTLLTLPAMNIPEDSAYSFGLSVYRSTNSKPTEGVRVFAHYAAPDTLVELAFVSRDYTVASGAVTAETAIGWYSYELPLPFAGVCNIVLQGESRYGTATYMDNLVVRKMPTCHKPKNLALSELTAHSAQLTWEGNASNYEVLITVANDTVAIDTVNTASLAVDTLRANTAYAFTVTVRGLCGGEDGESEAFSKLFSFRTDCEAVSTLPWKETFDNISSGIPSCWNNDEGTTTGATYKWYSYSTGHSGKCVRFDSYYNSDGNTNVLASPEIALPAGEAYDLIFWCKNPYGGEYSVKLSANGGDRVTLLSNLTSLSAWTEKTVDLSAYAGQTIQLFFCGTSNYENGDAYLYLDDVEIKKQPSCQKPHDFDVVYDTHNATFSWIGNADNYEVQLKQGSTTLLLDTINVATLVIDTLQANTAYSYTLSVRGMCGEEDGNSEVVTQSFSFRTDCEAVSTLPWSESFNDVTSGIPACWNNDEGTSTSYFWEMYATGYDGKCVRYNSYYNTNGVTNVLASPAITLPANEADELVFWCKNPTGGAYSVLLSADGGEKDTLFADLTGIADWTEKIYDLSAYAGQTIKIYFCGTSNYGNGDAYLYLDDVTVRKQPACKKPLDLAVSEVTNSSAKFSWTGTAPSYEVIFALGADTLRFDTISATSFVVDTLSANTDYTFSLAVRGICGVEDGDSEANSASFSFTTLCNLIAADELPFTEDFDGNAVAYGYGAELPDCWTRTIDGSYPYVYATSSYAHSGSRCLYFYGGGATSENYAVLPGIASDLNGLRIRFYYYNGTAADAHGYLYVGVMSDPTDTATFVPLRKLDKLTDYADEPAEVALVAAPEGYHYIAFRHAGGTSNYGAAYVDDITVDALPNCRKPSDLDKVVGENEVTFTWVSNGDETEWKVVAIDMLHPEADTIRQTVSTMAFTINSLTGNTKYSYSISVKASCGDNEESEALVQAFSFRTLLPASFTEHLSDGVPFVADFASEEERSKWVMVGDEEPNHFIFGNDTIGIVTGATAGLYVSNNDSLNYYTTNTSSATASVRQFQVSDTSMLFYHFQWKAYGESTADYGRAFIAPESAAIEVVSHALKINGTQVAPSSSYTSAVPDDAEDLGGGKLNLASAWTTVNDSVALAPGTYKLIFVWGNDFSVGTQYPMAVGDVVLTAINIEHSSSTDLDGLKGDEDFDKAVKFIRNGHVFILHRGVIYDSTGRRVSIR